MKLTNLNEALFAQLESLTDETVTGEELKQRMVRAKAVTEISKEIVSVQRLVLDVYTKEGNILAKRDLPAILEQQ